jgi:5-methylcytosine-specific restriction endonuclease McrA
MPADVSKGAFKNPRGLLRLFIYERDGRACGICGGQITSLADMHADHVVQRHDGGPTVPENLRATHAACNRYRPRGKYRVINWREHPDRIEREARFTHRKDRS